MKFTHRACQLLYFFIVFAFCFLSCNDGLQEENAANGNIEFRFNLPQSRVIISEDGSGRFEENEQVGLYAEMDDGNKYRVMTLQGGRWFPILQREDLASIRTLFTAFYPAPQTPNPANYNYTFHTVETDQSTEENYRKSDILAAQYDVVTNNNETVIPMTFRHQMHRLNITLTGLDTQVSDFKIEVYGRTKGLFEINREQPMKPADESPEAWITPYKTGEGTYSVLMAPQPVNIGSDRVRVTYNGNTYTYKFPSNMIGNSQMLDSGKETDIELRFMEESEIPADEEFAGKKLWVWGVEREGYPLPVYNEATAVYAPVWYPDKFPLGKWFYVDNQNPKATRYLSWQEGYGWYDCDKYNPEEAAQYPGPDDSHMCWAASASNALHWWMCHNREYIELYKQMYQTDWEEADLKLPAYEYTESLDDPVFSFFRKYFQNKSGDATDGINRFVSGISGPLITKADFDGFFNRVFATKADAVATFEAIPSKETFNRVIKEAFQKDRALHFAVHSFGGHAMTIWGAEFDEKGFVSHIYYVDNNDYYNFDYEGGGITFPRHRILRQAVRYEDGIVYLGYGKVTINRIGQIDLRRDIWEKWKQSLNK